MNTKTNAAITIMSQLPILITNFFGVILSKTKNSHQIDSPTYFP
jgi:hypothetical protein